MRRYTSDVIFTWDVADHESAISSSRGCDEVDITSDQDTADYTCAAISAGGSSHDTVSIKRDATAPVVGITGVYRRQLSVALVDGTTQTALFKFTM